MSFESNQGAGAKGPWRIRIVAYRLMPVTEILENPKAWRLHPEKQRNALRAALDHVGLVKPLIFNERTSRLVDGKARLELARRDGQEMLPVVIVDLSEEEEALVLVTLDPLSELAEVDVDALQRLLQEVAVDDTTLMELLGDIASDADLDALTTSISGENPEAPTEGGDRGNPPDDFPSYGEDIETRYCCPKCGYRWSGKPDAGGGEGGGNAHAE